MKSLKELTQSPSTTNNNLLPMLMSIKTEVNCYICKPLEQTMPDLSKTYLYRMTHIENVPHILEHGVTHASSPHTNKSYKAIGDNSIISTRDNFDLPNGKKTGCLHSFFFGVRMTMLYVIQKGDNDVPVTPAKDIVYCISSV